MKKVCYLVLCLLIISLATGCTSNTATVPYSSIYIDVFDSYFTFDTALHSDMKYLAIDLDTLKYATEDDKRLITEHFKEKFNIEVKNASFIDLEKQGLVKDGNYIDGILLSIDKINVNPFTITVEGTKFRSGLNAKGIKSVLKKSGGTWKLKSSNMTWIA
ncbi:MAG: hypothetical protein WCN92_02280 [Eubacteriales bacterium]